MFALLSAMVLLSGCLGLLDGEDEVEDLGEDKELDFAYTGILTISYSKDFPEIQASSTMNVELKKSGEFIIGNGEAAPFEADDEKQLDSGKIRQKDHGTLQTSPEGGVVIFRGEDRFVAIDVKVSISGEQETFAWDEDSMTWRSMGKVPYQVDDPIQPPVEFDIFNSTAFNGQTITGSAPQAFGSTVTYSWTLFLSKSLIG